MAEGTLVRVASYRRFPEGTMRRRSIIRSTRMLRIRQYIGLGFSIASSISPPRAAAYINPDPFSSEFAGRRP
jgi:hypothetical protein